VLATRKEQMRPDTVRRTESDSHTDTTAAGTNFLLITGKEITCTNKPFSNTYKALQKIPIVLVATTYDNVVTGVTFILVFHQKLWFGNNLATSLIFPQQIRLYGLSFCNDPYDPNKQIDIHGPETLTFLSFTVENEMVGLTTQIPTLNVTT